MYNAKVSQMYSAVFFLVVCPQFFYVFLLKKLNVTIELQNVRYIVVRSNLSPLGFWIPGEKEEKNLPLSRAKSTINLDRAMLRKAF